MPYVLSYDLGTSSIKASIYDEQGMNVASADVKYPTYYGSDTYHEQRPSDWWASLLTATKMLQNNKAIECIGISGHSMGAVAVTRDGCVGDRTPIWSDGRAVAQVRAYFKRADYRQWYEKTGCGFPPQLHTLFKLLWYKDKKPEIYDKAEYFIGTKDYLNYRLTGRIATDHSYASGSGYYALAQNAYDREIIVNAGLHPKKLPEIMRSDAIMGYLTKEAGELLCLPGGIPVVAGGVDNACAGLGAGCLAPGDAYMSLGTSAWITVTTERPVVDFDKKFYVWAHCIPGLYLPSAGVFSAGSSLEWVMANLFNNEDYGKFDELASLSPPGANGLLFCPVLAGGSSVDVSQDMRGGFGNLDMRHTRSDVARSVLEGIVFDIDYAYRSISDKIMSDNLTLVGGGAKSALWRQICADVFAVNTAESPVARETASLGAAALALNGAGIQKEYRFIREANKPGQIHTPVKMNKDVYKKTKPVFDELCRQQAVLYKLCKEMEK